MTTAVLGDVQRHPPGGRGQRLEPAAIRQVLRPGEVVEGPGNDVRLLVAPPRQLPDPRGQHLRVVGVPSGHRDDALRGVLGHVHLGVAEAALDMTDQLVPWNGFQGVMLGELVERPLPIREEIGEQGPPAAREQVRDAAVMLEPGPQLRLQSGKPGDLLELLDGDCDLDVVARSAGAGRLDPRRTARMRHGSRNGVLEEALGLLAVADGEVGPCLVPLVVHAGAVAQHVVGVFEIEALAVRPRAVDLVLDAVGCTGNPKTCLRGW